MAGIIATLSILGFILFFRRLIRWPIEALPMFVVSMVLVVNYLAGYLNILMPVCTTMLLLGTGLLLLAPFYLPKQRQALFQDYFTPGLMTLIFFIAIFGVMAQTIAIATGWDDLGRWLPFAKLIYYHNGLITPSYTPLFIDYPPGAALFYYFFLHLSGYSEGTVYYAQLFIVLTPLTILLRQYRWPDWSMAFILYSLLLLILIFAFDLRIGTTTSTFMDVPA